MGRNSGGDRWQRGGQTADRAQARRGRLALWFGALSGPLAVLLVLASVYAAGTPRPDRSSGGSTPPGDYTALCQWVDPAIAELGATPKVGDMVRLLRHVDLDAWARVAPKDLRPTLVELRQAVAEARPVLDEVAATGQMTRDQIHALPPTLVPTTERLLRVWVARCVGD